MAKLTDITEQHLRIGWQESRELIWDKPAVRYYLFSVAHDKIEAEAKLNMFLGQISPIEKIPIEEGRFEAKGRTKVGLYYHLRIVDSPTAFREVNLSKVGKNIIIDRRLGERKSGKILNYLNGIYRLK